MTKKQKKTLYSFIISLVIILVCLALGIYSKEDMSVLLEDTFGISFNSNNINTVDTANISNDLFEVLKVVDGDTIEINYNGNKEKVRLIGVDTPETVHPTKEVQTYGKEASSFTKSQLTGKKITLEFDVQQRDKYGRLLAYVYLDGKMFNKTLLEEGYAQIATFPPNVKYVDEFKQIQAKAKEEKKGLWGI